jgi:hypothetical protein
MKEIGILTELELPSDIPKNINEALGYDLTDKHHCCILWRCRVKPPICITVKVENQMNQISMPKSFFALSQND